MSNYGEKIKQIREEHGLTQRELEKKLKVKESLVSSWERSTYPPLKAIEKICLFFNINLWEFFIIDEKELNDYIPSWIIPEQIDFLKNFSNLPYEIQTILLKAFAEIAHSYEIKI